MTNSTKMELRSPKIVDRSTFEAELDTLRVREKAHTREGDAIAALRRRLPMVPVDATIQKTSEQHRETSSYGRLRRSISSVPAGGVKQLTSMQRRDSLTQTQNR